LTAGKICSVFLKHGFISKWKGINKIMCMAHLASFYNIIKRSIGISKQHIFSYCSAEKKNIL